MVLSSNGSVTVTKNPLRGSDQRVQARFKFRPAKVNFLFVCESVPKNDSFFYDKNSNLYDATVEAFIRVFRQINPVNFLDKFKEMGFYLDDLCSEPVNHLKIGADKKKRIALRKLYEPDLAGRIDLFQPLEIFVTPKEIIDNVQSAISSINSKIIPVPLPFPAYGNVKQYVEELSEQLERVKITFNL